MRRTTGLLVGLAATLRLAGGGCPTVADDKPPAWEPAKTWAVMIGVLEWEKPGLASFPKKGRVDRVLEKTLVERGVPAGHVTFLEDDKATLAACREALGTVCRGAGEGSTLVVYYAGHGVREGARTYITPYDTDTRNVKKTGLSLDEIGATIREEWAGSRLVLLADCCYSGAFADLVKGYEGDRRVKAACLSSAVACNVSTGAWTFSESVVATLRGDGAADGDGDGYVDVSEADQFVHREMRFRAAQLSEARRTSSFEPRFRLAPVDPATRVARVPGPWQPRDYAQVEWKGTWYRAQLLESRDTAWKVHYLGYPSSDDEWVAVARIRAVPPLPFAKGAAVSVEWKGTWWPATVVELKEEFAFVHYDDFGPEWDEWVTEKRIRERK